MPAGLQVWDASGRLILDSSSWIGRISGVITVPGSFDFTVPKEPSETVFAVPINTLFSYDGNAPSLTISNSRVYGWFPSGTRLVYGVY